MLAQDRPGGQEPEAVKDLIHTTAKEWKAARPVTGSPQEGTGSIFNRGRPRTLRSRANASRKTAIMPDAKELATERASGPSGSGEGPSEDKATPYIEDIEDGQADAQVGDGH